MTDVAVVCPATIRFEFEKLIVDDLLRPAGGPEEIFPTHLIPRRRFISRLYETQFMTIDSSYETAEAQARKRKSPVPVSVAAKVFPPSPRPSVHLQNMTVPMMQPVRASVPAYRLFRRHCKARQRFVANRVRAGLAETRIETAPALMAVRRKNVTVLSSGY